MIWQSTLRLSALKYPLGVPPVKLGALPPPFPRKLLLREVNPEIGALVFEPNHPATKFSRILFRILIPATLPDVVDSEILTGREFLYHLQC